MNAYNKTRSQSRLNALWILSIGITFVAAFFAGIEFDFITLGYFLLIILSPALVLFASDLKRMKKVSP